MSKCPMEDDNLSPTQYINTVERLAGRKLTEREQRLLARDYTIDTNMNDAASFVRDRLRIPMTLPIDGRVYPHGHRDD